MFSSVMAERQVVLNDITIILDAYTFTIVLGAIPEANQRFLGDETGRCLPSSDRLVFMVQNSEARPNDLHGIQDQLLR
jgi:hypothetical protein